MKKTICAGVYLRVSTQEQRIDVQRAELGAYVRKRGWKSKVYIDRESGATSHRDGLDALLSDCRKRKIDIVVCWALDRIARSLRNLLDILSELKCLKIEFVSYRQQIDTSTAAGNLSWHVLAAVAEFEREMLRERVIAGMVQARRRGSKIGRPPNRELTKQEIQQVLQDRAQNRTSFRDLARKFGISTSRAHTLCSRK